ncbi:hypothetical protein BDL97_16G043400 [Sphagnum fallax]|nr:hypothetical protein BDL97_16G043400 [Sphagnum fallax]
MCSPGLVVADDDCSRMRKVVVVDRSNCNNVQLAALGSHRELICCNNKIAASPSTSSSFYVLLFFIMKWLLRIMGFLLFIAKWFLIWFFTCFLRWCLFAIHKGFSRYGGFLTSLAFLGSGSMQQATGITKESGRLTYYNVDEVNSSAERWNPEPTRPSRRSRDHHHHMQQKPKASSVHKHHATPQSPLLAVILEDHMKCICEDNSSDIQDRERLVYEYTKIVAPHVSAFQLGEIVVPLRDTRQFVTFLKSKLRDTCRWQPIMSSEIQIATICHLILNLGLSSDDNDDASADDVDALPSESNTSCSLIVELSDAGVGSSASCNSSNNNIIQHAMIYMAAAKAAGRLHLVLVGHKVDDFSGSSEFRSMYNPPVTQREKQEWQAWNSAHLRALKESVVETAQQLLTVTPIAAQVW